MRQEPEFFEEQETALIYIARKLKEALALEKVLDAGGLDYAVAAEPYLSGILFRTQKTGAFFYVSLEIENQARNLLLQSGYKPFEP
jgi:hypothetical protein